MASPRHEKRRNIERFPEDFMFRLSAEEFEDLRRQFGASSQGGGRRYAPYAFSKHGVAMLFSVLRSRRAVRVNIEIMRAFVRLRRLLETHAELSRKLAALEQKYDAQFKVVFDAIRKTASSGQAGRLAVSPCLGTRFPSSPLVSRSFWPSSVPLFENL